MLKRKPRWKKIIAEYVMGNKETFYRIAYSYVQNPDDALDIVQDSIQKAITAETLKDEKAIRSWFYKIVVNTSLDFLRRKKKIKVVSDTTIQLQSPGHIDHYKDIDLHQALKELSPDYRSVIVLRYLEDLKIEEVADILDLNINTTKTRIYRGLEILRVQLEDLNLEEEKHNG